MTKCFEIVFCVAYLKYLNMSFYCQIRQELLSAGLLNCADSILGIFIPNFISD